MSYYGYVERENASQINWAEVGENLTGVLKKASDDRQAKRNAFDQSTKEYQEVLNKLRDFLASRLAKSRA